MSAAPASGYSGLECRLMRWNDVIPDRLRANTLKPDPFWTWLAIRDGQVVAGLFAGYYQGLAFVGTVNALPEAGVMWMRGLFRAFARDCQARNVKCFMTVLDESESAARLQKVLDRSMIHVEQTKGATCVAVGKLDVWC